MKRGDRIDLSSGMPAGLTAAERMEYANAAIRQVYADMQADRLPRPVVPEPDRIPLTPEERAALSALAALRRGGYFDRQTRP